MGSGRSPEKKLNNLVVRDEDYPLKRVILLGGAFGHVSSGVSDCARSVLGLFDRFLGGLLDGFFRFVHRLPRLFHRFIDLLSGSFGGTFTALLLACGQT